MAVDPLRQHAAWGVVDASSNQTGFGECLWNVESIKELKTCPKNGARTVLECLEKAKEAFPNHNAVGWRNFVKSHMVEDENGTKREKLEFENEYSWFTYVEYHERILNAARGFSGIGLEPKQRIVIYAETQRDWMVTLFASVYNNAQIVTIYSTLGEEGAEFGINQTKAGIVVADAKLLKTLIKVLPRCKSIRSIVALGAMDTDSRNKIAEVSSGKVSVFTMDDVVERGKTTQFSPSLPSPGDVAVIMYTSGTTGTPKGVMITHGNIAATVAGVEHDLQGLVTSDSVYLAYLPLAHIMELCAEIAMHTLGASVGFGTPHTLTDSGVKLKRPESIGDAACLKPTFMVFAPAVLDKIYAAVQGKRDTLGGVGRTLFDWGLLSGERRFKRKVSGANWFYNRVVFKKVQEMVGGRLEAIVTGSAPLSPEVQKFIQTVLKVPVRQGYGLTETCAGSAVGFFGDHETSSVGPPTVNSTMRLADWAEGNYLNADRDDPNIGMPRGEVLIGGPSVSLGYLLDESKPDPELKEKNETDWVTIDGIRFFRTGDIGQIRKNGTLQIIDRKKDLWKGPNGEYVALTKVEAALQLCPYTELSMCYGKTGGAYPIALICPIKKKLMELGEELGKSGVSFEELCEDSAVITAVADTCVARCKESRVAEFETPKKFALISELWTPENEMLTAAMKLKRPVIEKANKNLIDALYV